MATVTHWLSASDLTFRLPDGRQLYTGLSLSLGPGITALIGENGVGKSTLAAQLTGLHADHGAGRIQRHGHIGYLPQQGARPRPGTRLADLLGRAPLFDALRRIEAGRGSDTDLDTVADQWGLPGRLTTLLNRFGLPPLTADAPVGQLSGGELARLAMVRLLLDRPDHLILDEPGNHLDCEGREVLLALLREFRGGILLISHDRQLLALAHELLDLLPGGLRRHSGSHESYRERRRVERQQQAAQIAAEQRELKRQQAEAQRNLEKLQRRAATGKTLRRSGSQSTLLLDRQAERSEQTQGRLWRLAQARLQQTAERVATANARHDPGGEVRLTLPPLALTGGRAILHAEALHYRYHPQRPLIEAFSLQLQPGERLALHGPNGCGKSTLLRLFSGELPAQGGTIQRRVTTARLDQHLSLLAAAEGALQNFRRLAPGLAHHDYYARLDAMGLPTPRLAIPAGELSGGERVRLALACLLLGPEPAGLLLLDEPSNHLDLVATEALEGALRDYAGGLVVVSHDSRFLAELGIDRMITLPPVPNLSE